jgi:hypothetical protein
MARYKQRKPVLQYTTREAILETARNLKLPTDKWGQGKGQKGRWQRWVDFGEIVEAAAERIHRRAERDRIVDEWLSAKG